MGQPAYQNLSASCNDFAKSFYKQLSVDRNENVVSSPLSVHLILSLLSHGAEKETLDEFTSSLYHSKKDCLKSNYQSLLSLLNQAKDVKLCIANAIYVQQNFPVLKEFLNIAESYRSEIAEFDYKNNIEAARKINLWVEENTNRKISNLVSSEDFDESIKVVIVNAIYFNGCWLTKFDVRKTQKRIFHVSKTEKKFIPTMFNKFHYNHGEIPLLNAKFIEIPYKNKDIALIVILPNEVDGLANVENHFSWQLFKNAEKSNTAVHLYLPKFHAEFTVDLENTLRKLGLNKMFQDNAEFGQISDVPLKVSKILHKTVIEVNEEGTEAAAATNGVIRERREADMSEQFIVDRPFMFIINHIPSEVPLFIGSVKDIKVSPEKDEL